MDELNDLRMQIHIAEGDAKRIRDPKLRLSAKLYAYSLTAKLWKLLGDDLIASFYEDNVRYRRDVGWATYNKE